MTLVKKLTIKILNSKLTILLVYQNIKIFLHKAIFQTGLKEFLWLKKLKTQCPGYMLLVVLKAKKFFERFIKKNWKNKSKSVYNEKLIKRKGDKLYFKWKGYNSFFNS